MYCQTFHNENNSSQLSLLPLAYSESRATHAIISSLHLLSTAGEINLNDFPPSNAIFDSVWADAKILQSLGVKVMAMMGGAGAGSYARLMGSDADVCLTNS